MVYVLDLSRYRLLFSCNMAAALVRTSFVDTIAFTVLAESINITPSVLP